MNILGDTVKILYRVNENIFIMPTYGIALSSSLNYLSEEAVINISNKIIESETPLLATKDNMLEFKSYKRAFNVDAILSLTNDCNMFCQYCYYSSGGYKNEYLSPSDIDIIVRKLYKNAVISKLSGVNNIFVTVLVCGGGEPTLAWSQIIHLVEALKKLKQSTGIDYRLSISTNGVFSRQKASFLA